MKIGVAEITDKGGEFTGQRLSELCIRYGVEINTLPPFRAEEKPLVERVIGLVQDSYKSMLQGKGGIGADVNERWAIDYRQQAVLTLEEYTQIVVHCIINLNKGRVLKGLGHLPAGVPQTPASLWLWFLAQGKTALMDVDAHEVYLCSLPRTTAKVSRKGISFNHMRYLPPRGTELCVGEKVEFDAVGFLRLYHNSLYLIDHDKAHMVGQAENLDIGSNRTGSSGAHVEILRDRQQILRKCVEFLGE